MNADPKRSSKRVTRGLWIIAILVGGVFFLKGCLLSSSDVMGARASGKRLDKMKASPQWDEDASRFDNRLERIDGSWPEMVGKFFFGGSDYLEPDGPLNMASQPPQTSPSFRSRGFE